MLILIVDKYDYTKDFAVEILYTCTNLTDAIAWLNSPAYNNDSSSLEWQLWEPGCAAPTKSGKILRNVITTYEYQTNIPQWDAGESSGT